MTSIEAFTLARRLRAGETVHTAWCGLPAPIVAEFIAREGFSTVLFDQQHGLYDMSTTAAAIAAVRAAGAAPMVRIPLGDFAVASRVLDFGAEGIVAPMINTEADARALVAATRFPPIGERSWGPARAMSLAGISDFNVYLRGANESTVIFAMIETRSALANMEAIAATPGIDGLFLGPSDLSITLSNGATINPHSKEVETELDRIIQVAHKVGKIAGAYCATAERAVELSKRGIRFFAIASDTAFLRAGTAAALKVLRG
jgi:4-hydroxy-2-oxoheptanedioate aldolase